MFKEFSLEYLVLGSSLIWKKEKLAKMVTRCHSLSFVVPLVVTRCHSLSFVVTRCTTRCHSLYHLLSLVVICCHSLYHSLSLIVTPCTTLCLFINDLNQKIITYILEFVFITQNHIFLSEIHLKVQ